MKQTRLSNLILFIALIALSSSLSTTNKQTDQKFLEPNEPRLSLAEMLAKKNLDNEKAETPSLGVPMENSGYLFYGYNMFYGNPHSTEGSIDPGFTNPIFGTSYELNNTTGDLRFKVPDGAVLGKNVGCDVSLTSSAIKDASSYRKSLEAEVSGGASFGVGSFSASASFKAVLEGTSSNESMYVESKADCRVFSGHLNFYRPPQLDLTFVTAIDYIDELDFKDAKDDYFTFIDYFGTHFVNRVDMGARYGYLEKTTVKEYTSGNTVSASLSISASYGVGSASAKVGASSEDSKAGSNKSNDVKAFSIGVPPPADRNPFTWAEKSLQEPMPIKYSVRPISEIFTNRFFDLAKLHADTVKIDVGKFAKNLDAALNAYCSEYLKPKGKTSFCDQNEYDKLLKNITAAGQSSNAVKIENGALIKVKNVFKDRCITYRGNRQTLILEPCTNNNANQVFKLIHVASQNAYRIVTNGPLSNGQWDYGAGNNRLFMWDYGDDLSNWRHFNFFKDANDVYKIKTLQNLNGCLQAISNENHEIHLWQCNGVSLDWVITKP